MKKKTIVSSLLTIVLCLSLIAGSTYALFTSEDEINIAVASGKVNVVATILEDGMKTYSLDEEQAAGKFANGGIADFAITEEDGKVLTLDKMTPGDKVVFAIEITNNSNVAMKYRVAWDVSGELAPALKATAGGDKIENGASAWTPWAIPVAEDGSDKVKTIEVVVELPAETGNEYQDKSAKITFTVDAIQGNAPTPDEWDGTADTSWYNDTDTEFVLDTAEQFAGLMELVDGGNTFEDKTIVLENDLDLYQEGENGEPICFDPIGSYRNDQVFKGTFDGQGNTIMNLYQNTWALDNGYYYGDCGLGLFGAVENATIKDLTVDGADISGESALCGVIAAVAGDGCTFENITVKNANCADYQYYAGGIVGWASGKQTYTNCVIDASTNIAAQWGDFNNAVGGVIGGASGSAEILIKDCTVACRIDAYNDVTSAYEWYAYRNAGMLIGNTNQTQVIDGTTYAAAPQLTCENVTVIYGDWANYHYCQFGAMAYPWVRVEAGVSNSAYSNPRYGHPTDANGNEVVDDNHAHNEGEKHHELIVFDQLIGGACGDRYCAYGYPTHAGVTVVYNNKD